MQSAQNIFERKEKKYVLTREQADALLAAIDDYIEPDSYPDSAITSIYYDTSSHEVIERSIAKPVYKEKLRVRDYGMGSVFVELKKKYKGIVYKRRIEMSRKGACAWLDEGWSYLDARNAYPLPGQAGCAPAYADMQISREVDAFRARYADKLVPSMDVFAHRLSYREKGNDQGCRLTMDVEILYSDVMAHQDSSELLTDKVVMEIKVPGAYPLWLTHALTELELFPSSFSKYGNAYKRLYLSGVEAARPSVAIPFENEVFPVSVVGKRFNAYNGGVEHAATANRKVPAYA